MCSCVGGFNGSNCESEYGVYSAAIIDIVFHVYCDGTVMSMVHFATYILVA